jgi:hypothetical protein
MEIDVKTSSDFGGLRHLRAGSVGAALIDQKTDKAMHDLIVGATDECRRLSLLDNQANGKQSFEMIGKRRARQIQLSLQLADAKASIPGAHKRTVDLKARWIAEGFKAGCGVVDFHADTLRLGCERVNHISRKMEVSTW